MWLAGSLILLAGVLVSWTALALFASLPPLVFASPSSAPSLNPAVPIIIIIQRLRFRPAQQQPAFFLTSVSRRRRSLPLRCWSRLERYEQE